MVINSINFWLFCFSQYISTQYFCKYYEVDIFTKTYVEEYKLLNVREIL